MTQVTCTTVTYHDSQANSHKFYRAYSLGRFAIFQWGRVGAVGQWSGVRCASDHAARLAARDKLSEKQARGYTVESEIRFDYDDAAFPIEPSNKATLIPLDTRRQMAPGNPVVPNAAPAPAPTPAPPAFPPPAPGPKPKDVQSPHEAFTARALAAVTLAVTDSQAAMVELALLNEQWAELQQIHSKAESYRQTLENMLLGASVST